MGLFDGIMNMFNGKEGEGNGFLMNMVIKQISAPGTQKMITGKMEEMFLHLANQFSCEIKDISLMLRLEEINEVAKGEDGTNVIQMDPNTGLAKKIKKPIIYFYKGTEAVQKVAIEDFFTMMIQDQKQEQKV